MSALNLLSVIAPVGPSAPQGSPGEVASGFQGMLATVTEASSIAPEAGSAPDALPDEGEADIAPPVVPGFLVAPMVAPVVAPPIPPVIPPAIPPATATPPAPPTDAAAETGAAGATGPAIAPEAGSADGAPTTAVAAPTPGDPGELRTTPSPPLDKGPAPKTLEPQVQPAIKDFRPLLRPAPTEAAPAPVEAAAATVKPEAPSGPAAPPPPATPPAPVPQPLRPLAERTSRATESSAPGAGETDRAIPRAASAGASTTVPAAGPDPSARPADPATLAAGESVTPGETEGTLPEAAPSGEAPAGQTQATAAGREPGLSQLSRVAIDATAQIAAQILRKLDSRSTRFEMALTPDDLGRVDVSLDIDSEGRLAARLAFDNPAAAADLRGRADELRRQLEDAGFHLADDAFEFAERDSGSSAFDRGRDARDGQNRAFAAASRLNAEIDVAQPPRWLALSLSPSGVDMKV